MIKIVLDLILMLLKVLREFFGLIQDIKHPRRHNQK